MGVDLSVSGSFLFRGAMYYCYVIGAGPYVKIGWTGSLERRMRELETCCPFVLKTVCMFTYDTQQAAVEMESYLHKHFHRAKVKGEWFKREVVIKQLRKHGKIITTLQDLTEDQRSHMMNL